MFDVNVPSRPILKGVIEDVQGVWTNSFYSAFVDTTTPEHPEDPVWLFAVSNICNGYEDCNDTVYVFNIRPIVSASLDDAP